jgi:hypothetical protein
LKEVTVSQPFHESPDFPDTADQLLAAAIRRDVESRLEQAMHDDAEIGAFLETAGATVVVDVVIDRELGPGGLEFGQGRPDNQPLAGVIGQPSVAAMLDLLRRRVRDGEAARRHLSQEPFCFEISVHPDVVMPLGA